MNPAKRKRLYRIELEKQKSVPSQPVVLVEEVKKEISLGLKELPKLEVKEEVKEEKVLKTEVAVEQDTKRKKKV